MLCFGSLGFVDSDPRCGPTYRSSSHAVEASHIQNRGKLAQMLTQGQSSFQKKQKQKQQLPQNCSIHQYLLSTCSMPGWVLGGCFSISKVHNTALIKKWKHCISVVELLTIYLGKSLQSTFSPSSSTYMWLDYTHVLRMRLLTTRVRCPGTCRKQFFFSLSLKREDSRYCLWFSCLHWPQLMSVIWGEPTTRS